MPYRKFPDADPTKNYVIAGKCLGDVFDALEQDGKMAVAPPLMLADGPGGKVLSIALPPSATILRLTSNATAAGTYNARTQVVSTNTQGSTDDLSLSSWLSDLQTSDDAIFENGAENANPSGTHTLTTGANSYVIARLGSRFASDLSNRPIYEGIVPASSGTFLVALTKDGGSDGSSTAAASWTYTVKSLDGNTTWGTGLSPLKPRWTGKWTQASKGIGCVDNANTFQLCEAYEARTTTGCS
jgi:hypothetical protein